jgi:hypothetical protein
MVKVHIQTCLKLVCLAPIHIAFFHLFLFNQKKIMRDKQVELELQTSEFENLELKYLTSKEYGFLMSTKQVADGFGTTIGAVYFNLSNNNYEFIEGVHYIKPYKNGKDANVPALSSPLEILRALGLPHNSTLWTRQGVIRLGFFIKSKRAKAFRDWAENIILDMMDNKQIPVIQEVPQNEISNIKNGLFELMGMFAARVPRKELIDKVATLYHSVEKGATLC